MRRRLAGWVEDHPWVVAGLALAAVVALRFRDALLFRGFFHVVDLAYIDHPIRVLAARAIRAGELPFWAPELLMGYPLFAEGQAAVLYPLSWVYLLLPDERGLNLLVVASFAVAAAGMLLLLKELRLPAWAGLAGAATFTFSAFLSTEHLLPNALAVTALAPWLLAATRRVLDRGRRRDVAALGVVGALQTVAGDPWACVISWTGAALFALAWIACQRPAERPSAPRLVAASLAATLLAAGLSAPQWVPLFEFVEHSTRLEGAPHEHIDGFAARLEYSVTTVMPSFFGRGPIDFREISKTAIWEENDFWFLGVGLLALWPFIFRLGWRSAAPFAALVAVGVVMASVLFGSQVSALLYDHTFLGLFRWPARWLLLFAVAGAALVAMALQAAVERPPGPRGRRWVFAAWALGVAGCTALAFADVDWPPNPVNPQQPSTEVVLAWRRGDLPYVLLGAPLLMGALALGWRGTISKDAAGWAGAALVVTLVALPRPGPPLGDGSHYRAPELLADAFPQQGVVPPRVLSPENAWYPLSKLPSVGQVPPFADQHVLHGLSAPDVFDVYWTTTLERNETLLENAGGAVADLVGVDYVIVTGPGVELPSEAHQAGSLHEWVAANLERFEPVREAGGLRLLANPSAMPRAFVVYDWEVIPGREQRIERLGDEGFDPRRRAVLEAPPGLRPSLGRSFTPAAITVYQRHRVEIEVDAAADGLLVLTDSFYPGWEVAIDGEPREVLPAYEAFRGVPVDAGRHRVVFAFAPRTLRRGLGLGAVLLVAAVGVAEVASRLRPRAGARPARE